MSARPFTACVVGSGAREHALALGLARTVPVVVTPGNPGIAGRSPEGHRIAVDPRPPEELEADLVVVGPEAPLVGGLADRLRADGRLVVGPGADGARLEGSKEWMKDLLSEAGVATARYGAFDEVDPAVAFIRTLSGPFVVKTDGLAGGKGVLVTDSASEAEADIRAKLSGEAFGDAGRRVVVEEGLEGPECSLLVLCDGRRVVPLDLAQDFKRLSDGDEGPNTGGMGAYSPLPWAPAGLVDQLVETSVEPLVHALRRRGVDYRGVLYAGLMLTDEGPKVLEYNVRFGDPEAEVVVPRLSGDLAEVLSAAAGGRLTGSVADSVRFRPDAALCVVLAAEGYPTSPRTGDVIEGLGPDGQLVGAGAGLTVFHGATRLEEAPPVEGEAPRFVTAGGRVLTVTAVAPELGEARERAYRAADRVGWEGVHLRRDIAADALAGRWAAVPAP